MEYPGNHASTAGGMGSLPGQGTKVLHTVLISVDQSCLTTCNPMDCSMPGFPVHHQFPELVQTQNVQTITKLYSSHMLAK